MPLYTFTCPEHGSFDSREPYDTEVIHCACGKASGRESVYRVNFGGFASTPEGQYDFHQDYRRFREASEQLDSDVSKVERDEGVNYTSPLFKQAKAAVADLTAKGVSIDQI